MQRKFTEKERDAIRNKYGTEPLFQVAEVICQFFDNRLPAFVLWPEDIFNEAASVIDNIKENGDEYIPKIQHLWKTSIRDSETTTKPSQMSKSRSLPASFWTSLPLLSISVLTKCISIWDNC